MPAPKLNTTVPLRHRWLQFSLRTFLIAVTVFGAWLGQCIHRAEKQKRAVAAVQKLGGKVFYAHQAGPNLTSFDTSKDLNVPGWLRQLAGDDFFQSAARL